MCIDVDIVKRNTNYTKKSYIKKERFRLIAVRSGTKAPPLVSPSTDDSKNPFNIRLFIYLRTKVMVFVFMHVSASSTIYPACIHA
jgi:hypothetical protein